MVKENEKERIETMDNNATVRFTWLSGDVNYLDYGGKWFYNTKVEGYYLVMELINLLENDSQSTERYMIELSIVNCRKVEPDKMRSVKSFCGIDDDNLPEDYLVECCHSYGLKSVEYSATGNNYKQLRKECLDAARYTIKHLRSSLNKSKNALYATGHDMIEGKVLGILEGGKRQSLRFQNVCDGN